MREKNQQVQQAFAHALSRFSELVVALPFPAEKRSRLWQSSKRIQLMFGHAIGLRLKKEIADADLAGLQAATERLGNLMDQLEGLIFRSGTQKRPVKKRREKEVLADLRKLSREQLLELLNAGWPSTRLRKEGIPRGLDDDELTPGAIKQLIQEIKAILLLVIAFLAAIGEFDLIDELLLLYVELEVFDEIVDEPGGITSTPAGGIVTGGPRVCLYEIRLDHIVIKDATNTGKQWAFKITVDDSIDMSQDPAYLDDNGIFPVVPKFGRLWKRGCGEDRIKFDVIASQYEGVNDSGRSIQYHNTSCGKKGDYFIMKFEVVDRGTFTNGANSDVEIHFDIASVCVAAPAGLPFAEGAAPP